MYLGTFSKLQAHLFHYGCGYGLSVQGCWELMEGEVTEGAQTVPQVPQRATDSAVLSLV